MRRRLLHHQGGCKKWVIPTVLASVGYLIAGITLAYDSHNAHRALTYEAAEFYNLTAKSLPTSLLQREGLTPEEIEWMMDGAEQEDTPPRWINHFYNPITGEGWTGEEMGDIPSDTLRLLGKLALSSRDPISAKNWAKNRSAQSAYAYYGGDQTWQKAVEAYAAGNKKEAFEALGHILHLLEDMTVPDHTRGDTHAGLAGDKGSPYETWAKNYTAGKEKNLQIAGALYKAGPKSQQFPIIENYFDWNANYSSKNFFSADTIYSKTLVTPSISGHENRGLDTIVFAIINNDRYPLFKYPTGDTDVKNFTIQDPLILSAYWERLSKQAVMSGAGAINLFFQDVENYKKLHPNPVQQQIVSNSKIFSPFGELVKIGSAINNFVLGAKTIAADILPSAGTTIDINDLSPPAPSDSGMDPGSVSGMTETENPPAPSPIPSQSDRTPDANARTIGSPIAGEITPVTIEPQLYVSRVVDGDTVTLNNGKDVRLIGINSPEIGEKCADEAAQELKNLILGKYITLQKDTSEMDKYGRLLRFIYLDGTLVNAEMIKNGFAREMTIPPDTKFIDAFRVLEDEAKFFNRGCLYEKSLPTSLLQSEGADKTPDDRGPYYGGSSYAGGISIQSPDTIGYQVPDSPATSTPADFPPIATPTSTPDIATSTPETATSTPAESVPQIKILINEIQITGDSARDEFIELYNPSDALADITDWKMTKKTKSGSESNLVSKFSASTTIPARSYFLIVPQSDGTTTATPADATYTGASYSVAADNTVLLKNQSGQIIDKVGFGEAADFESQPAPNPPKNQSVARQNFDDTENNFNDFIISSSTPQGTSSTPVEAPPPPPPPPPEPPVVCDTLTYETHDNNKGAVIPDIKRLPEIYANVDTILEANTTYLVDYQIYVKPKAKLIIPEGVVIKFGWWQRDGWFSFPAVLRVAGSLEVNGTKNNPVIFTSFRDDAHGTPINATTSTPAPGDWGALQIESKKDETVKIQGAKFYYGGGHRDAANGFGGAIFINLSDAEIDISDTEVAQSISGIYSRAKSGSQPEILNSNFEKNKSWGVALEKDSAIKMVGNTMKCNGLLGGGGGAYIKGGSPDIIMENNNFLANETMGLQYVPDKKENLTAVNNYWGHSSGPFHATANPAGLGNAVSGNVIFSPFLTSAYSNSY